LNILLKPNTLLLPIILFDEASNLIEYTSRIGQPVFGRLAFVADLGGDVYVGKPLKT